MCLTSCLISVHFLAVAVFNINHLHCGRDSIPQTIETELRSWDIVQGYTCRSTCPIPIAGAKIFNDFMLLVKAGLLTKCTLQNTTTLPPHGRLATSRYNS